MLGKSRKIGVWIDHRQAVIVAIEEDAIDVETVESHIDGRARAAGGARSGTPYGPQDAIKEHSLGRRFESRTRGYYEDVLKHIGEASEVYAFGPANARQEFLEVIGASPLHRDTTTETAPCDKLTGPQIVAQVKEHFGA